MLCATPPSKISRMNPRRCVTAGCASRTMCCRYWKARSAMSEKSVGKRTWRNSSAHAARQRPARSSAVISMRARSTGTRASCRIEQAVDSSHISLSQCTWMTSSQYPWMTSGIAISTTCSERPVMLPAWNAQMSTSVARCASRSVSAHGTGLYPRGHMRAMGSGLTVRRMAGRETRPGNMQMARRLDSGRQASVAGNQPRKEDGP
jgi:hypothetical protein